MKHTRVYLIRNGLFRNDFSVLRCLKMLNSIIKIDLHIHSELSSYKEDEKHRIVSDSTIENLPILFQKLEQFDVNLISFTDHNRFNLEMYCAARKIIEQCEYPI